MQNTEIKLNCVNGIWYAEDINSGYWGKASSPDEAVSNIEQQKTNYAEFQRESGFKPISSIKPQLVLTQFFKNIWPSIRVLIIFSLACIPLHLAIYTGIKEGGSSIKNSLDGEGIWGRIDKIILKLGDPKFELSKEETEELHQAIERIKDRYNLLTNEQIKETTSEE
ncbi:hypothetical protein [Curvivirga aplysinae]|uniref:hypothetical protein n=1 Tax=Curvivirga aplysinae TaxID=2529852 RepID=UPI0012BCC930|nr:hypothetical protein [Curvivirga aplysinae]MTI09386.1 hypothetical protein [Curvivirga aplysinae]